MGEEFIRTPEFTAWVKEPRYWRSVELLAQELALLAKNLHEEESAK